MYKYLEMKEYGDKDKVKDFLFHSICTDSSAQARFRFREFIIQVIEYK